jgi:hypothetical protein
MTTDLQDDIIDYVRSRFEKLDRAADQIKESALKMTVAVYTQCKEPVYSRVLERVLAGYTETPADKFNQVVKRITAEEVARADAE